MKKAIIISFCLSASLLSSCGETAESSQSETKSTSATTQTQASESSEVTTTLTETTTVSEVDESDVISDESNADSEDVYYVTYCTSTCTNEDDIKSTITDKERIDKINAWLDKVNAELDKYEVDSSKIDYNGGDCIGATTIAKVTDEVYHSHDYWVINLTYVTIPEERVKELVEQGSVMANFSYDLNHNYMLPDEYIEEIYYLLMDKNITIENPLTK